MPAIMMPGCLEDIISVILIGYLYLQRAIFGGETKKSAVMVLGRDKKVTVAQGGVRF